MRVAAGCGGLRFEERKKGQSHGATYCTPLVASRVRVKFCDKALQKLTLTLVAAQVVDVQAVLVWFWPLQLAVAFRIGAATGVAVQTDQK